MDERIDSGVLWARALAVGVIAFFLGVAGHVTADGLLPGPLLSAILLAISVLLSVPVLSRPASPLRLVTLLVGGQTLIHLALSVTGGHRGDPVAGPTTVPRIGPATAPSPTGLDALPMVDGRRVGSLQDAYQGAADQSALAPTLPVGHLVADLGSHAPMMAAHLGAAALVGLWLAYGERCLWAVIALTGRVLQTSALLTPVVALPARRSTSAFVRAAVRPRSVWLAGPESPRGPPLLVV